ncbi:MAG: hypothetical protein GX089_12675 [Fibrobacter sp.]|jgi:hypothetical protein|nr:hypothetical protein [Fibrobacter sp.]
MNFLFLVFDNKVMVDGFSAATTVLRQILRFLEIKTCNCDSGSGSVSESVSFGLEF